MWSEGPSPPDGLWTAFNQHQRFERWLVAEDLPEELLAPEDYAELFRIAAARLERAEPEQKPLLLRAQKNLGRSCLKGLYVLFRSGQDVSPEVFAAQLATFPPEVAAAFLRPFRRFLD